MSSTHARLAPSARASACSVCVAPSGRGLRSPAASSLWARCYSCQRLAVFAATCQVGCEVRNYTMHFVRFVGLMPRRAYKYQVRSGSEGGVWSDVFTFRAPCVLRRERTEPDPLLGARGAFSV